VTRGIDARPGWPVRCHGLPHLIIRAADLRPDDRQADWFFIIGYLDTWLAEFSGRRSILEMFQAVAGYYALPARGVDDPYIRRSVIPRLREAFRRGELLLLEQERIETPSAGVPPPEPERSSSRERGGESSSGSSRRDRSETHWVEVLLLDEKQKPAAGERYRIELPGGAIVEGTLDEQGLTRHDNLQAGNCKIHFPDLDAREWSGDGDWRIARAPLTWAVKQGEHISSLAKKYGFGDFRLIWDDAKNVDLKTRRQNPNVLLPGDPVYIPEKRDKEVVRAVDQRHSFDTTRRGLTLRLVIRNMDNDPVAGQPCKLQVEGGVYQLTTGEDGSIERDIPRDAGNGVLEILDMTIPLAIGHMDPEDTPTGQQARLTNLGYYWGPLDDTAPEALKSAIEEFQCDQNLKVTGVCDATTQSKLKEVHGC